MPGAWVQDDTNVVDAGSTTIAKAFGSNVTAGNLIAVVVGNEGDVTCTVADTLGNTYTQKTATYDASNGQKHFQFYAKDILGGACTVTATLSLSKQYRRLGIMEISGCDTTAPDDGGAAQVQAGGTTTDYYSSVNIATTVTDFVFGDIQDISGSGATLTAGATPAYTLREVDANSVIGMESLASQAAATFDANFTRSTAGNRSTTGVMAFKEAAAGGSVVPVLMAEYRQRKN